MDDFNTVYALLVLVMLFVLLSRLDNRFGKVERELNEIKKRMDDYLKLQQKTATEEHKPKEEIVVKETEDVPLISQMTEHVTVIKAAQQGKVVSEKQESVVETVRETLGETLEKTVETELEEVCIEAVRKESAKSPTVPVIPVAPAVSRQKKQVNYERFIGENLFGKYGAQYKMWHE